MVLRKLKLRESVHGTSDGASMEDVDNVCMGYSVILKVCVPIP